MAVASLILCLAIFLIGHEKARAQNFGIVEPYPENINPIEFESAKVTCVAFDPTGVKTPEKIIFLRISRIQNSVELKPNGNLFLENRTEEFRVSDERNATKLFVTLNIRNVTIDDDSDGSLGRYECHAFAVNDSVARKHGFTVNVIPVADLPKISVSANRTVKHNSRVEIACNLTEGEKAATTSLKSISWYKNGELYKRVRSPDPDKTEDTLEPLYLQSAGVRDAGIYTCLLEVVLEQKRDYNISKSMELRIAPWLTPPDEDIEVKSFKDETVQFNCAAKGNPLEVEWKVQKKGKDEVQACINGSNGKYEVKRNGPFDPYFLLVKNLQYTDRGFYYCCLPTNCSDSVDGCQRFILRVRDPLGPLWPVIGILAEALVLFLIIYVAEKRKKSKENGQTDEWNSVLAPLMTAIEDKCACAKLEKARLRETSGDGSPRRDRASEHLWNSLVASKSVKQQSTSEEEDPLDVTLIDALAECYNNTSHWSTRRQILPIIADKASFQTLQRWIPGLTRYRFKIARHHRLLHGRGSVISPPCHSRMYVAAGKLDDFLDFITSAHIVQDLPFGERTLKLSSKEKIIVPNVARSAIPERIVQQYDPFCSEDDFVPMGRSTLLRFLISVPLQFETLFRDLIISLHKVRKPSMNWRMLLKSLEMTVGCDCHGTKKRRHS
ncbi:uncharacterized protein [Montipora foliosa]|uniref:uncharacterized protein n=1 Tax=Montipora foliosa TaxID=591990 RepID=UPI0035F18891